MNGPVQVFTAIALIPGIGKPGQWSAGNTLTSVGAVLLAGALLTTGAAVIAS